MGVSLRNFILLATALLLSMHLLDTLVRSESKFNLTSVLRQG